MTSRWRIGRRPFPEPWRRLLSRRLAHWPVLTDEERRRLETLVGRLLTRTRWEGAAGLDPTDEVRVTIAGHACLLLLGLDIRSYRNVASVIVYPSTAVRRGERSLGGGIYTDTPTPLHGEARLHGPVMIAWDAARRGARRPELGRNVVYHEFAHKLDMLDGVADGTPPIEDPAVRREWARVSRTELHALRGGATDPFLDSYGATNPAEFFAVATESFFCVPTELAVALPSLYRVLVALYRQDPAARFGLTL